MRLQPMNWFRRARNAPLPGLLGDLPGEPSGGEAAAHHPDGEDDAARPRRLSSAPAELWTAAHASLLDDLFGDGYVTPGGAEEVLRLVRPIGLTEGMTMLLLGAGTGGPVLSLVDQCNVWVSGYEAVPAFAKVAEGRIARAKLGPRASVEPWFPSTPAFRPRFFHHAMSLLALDGSAPEKVLAAVVESLRPGGHLVMLEIVADPPVHAEERVMKSWLTLDRRLAALPNEYEITRMLTKLGFDVRVAEDVTAQHLQAAKSDWKALLREIDRKPNPDHAALMVAEAERWMLRFELMRARRIGLVRWHAILGNRK